MTRLLPAVFALLLPVAAALAQDSFEGSNPMPGEMGNPVIGGPLGNNDPEDIVPVPRATAAPLPSTPQEQDQLRSLLVGKPVFGGGGGGRIGEVSDIAVGPDQRVTSVVIRVDAALDPDRANLPVPWHWIRSQLDAPTLVVPWNTALVAWLTEPGRSRRTVAQAAPSPAERAAWQQQTAAELDQWRARIESQASSLDERDPGLRQLQLAYGAARDRWERLAQADDDGWGVEQDKLQADLEDLRETWTEVAETP